MKKFILSIIFVVSGMVTGFSQSLKYQASSPENNSEISSLNELTLQFDFSDVYSSLGGTEEDWGVCTSSNPYNELFPELEKTVALFEGTPENGVVLERIAETIKPPTDNFKTGNSITFKFSNIEVKPQQTYTVVVKYTFYAGKKGDTTWKKSTKLDFSQNPLVLTFKGGEETQKVLKMEQAITDLNVEYEEIPQIKLSFNYGVTVMPEAKATFSEKGTTITESSKIEVDSEDNTAIIITFPKTTIFNGHVYDCVIPENMIAVADETDILNSLLSVQIKGASFHTFGTGRVSPPNNSTAIIDNIVVPFKFPVIGGSNWSYGFVNVKNAKYPMRLYKGTEKDGELIATINGEPDNSSLEFAITCNVEPGTLYTCVIDEGTVKAYAIGDPRESYLKDYISEKVVLTYTTPTLESLPELVLPQSNVQDGSSLESVETITIADAYYVYNGTQYILGIAPSASFKTAGVLYEVLADGSEKEVKRFEVNKSSRDAVVLRVNEQLYQGKNYRIVIPAGTITAANNFLKQFVGNKEYSITVTGAKSTESASEFTSGIVEGQKLSHVGVVSFYTAGDVKATDNAKLEIRNGEETVASAPVRVAKEEGYTHVYADFSGEGHQPFATEKGVTYAAVLPQGAVAETANENLLNKEHSVSFTGMAPEAVYHNVTLSLDNAAAQTSAVEEGKTVSFQLTPVDDLWTVESVENATLDEASGMYVTEPVKADTEVKAVFALVNPVDFNFTTEVEEVPAGCAYSVRSEGEMLIIEGVTAGDNIRIYTTGGTLIADKTVPADMSVAAMNLAPGIYIVAINNTTLKIRH